MQGCEGGDTGCNREGEGEGEAEERARDRQDDRLRHGRRRHGGEVGEEGQILLISLCSLLLFSNIQRGNFCCISLMLLSLLVAREAEQREKFRRKREAMKARQKKKKVNRLQRM